jgi:hypothetical protein
MVQLTQLVSKTCQSFVLKCFAVSVGFLLAIGILILMCACVYVIATRTEFLPLSVLLVVGGLIALLVSGAINYWTGQL